MTVQRDEMLTQRCSHVCHEKGLNYWVERCPTCLCQNKDYDPNGEMPEWAKNIRNDLMGSLLRWEMTRGKGKVER